MAADTLFVAKTEVMDCDIGGDRALLHLENNTYFTVNPTAAAVWKCLEEPATIDILVGAVTEKFEVTDEVCRGDVEAVLAEMIKADIVKEVTA
ncbi:hypothetical protein DSM14862_04064 (plasmid) [Sulfitobacter indolifex]|nr:PqqD family protein [Sulfitobacter indolifex]UOA21224.1 hypothetical protein DSM14862_04064 [Sulfitobacter indolifex]